MAVTEATCSGNGSERVDRNGVATATTALLVTVREPILEEYAGEARCLSKVKDEADLEVGCREASKELTLCIRVERLSRLVRVVPTRGRGGTREIRSRVPRGLRRRNR